jgi:predicted membrane-bound spermidine synthase
VRWGIILVVAVAVAAALGFAAGFQYGQMATAATVAASQSQIQRCQQVSAEYVAALASGAHSVEEVRASRTRYQQACSG